MHGSIHVAVSGMFVVCCFTFIRQLTLYASDITCVSACQIPVQKLEAFPDHVSCQS